MNDTKPIVSICCITYNHENYIRDAIEGFLMQKTTFPIEIIIHDDASTDKTAKIVKCYAEKYPNLIVPIFQRVNKYSQGIKPSPNYVWPKAQGKYIALCEGDDYWIDPNKLQKQVNFLNSNQDYGLVHADCNFYMKKTNQWEYKCNNKLLNRSNPSHKDELFKHIIDSSYRVRTSTVLFRKNLLEKIKPNSVEFLMGDTPLWLDFSQLTKFYYMDEVHSVYRLLDESASRSKNIVKQLRFNLSMKEMRIYYCKKYFYPISPQLKRSYNKALLIYRLYDPSHKGMFQLQAPSLMQLVVHNTSQKSVSINRIYKISFKIISYCSLFLKMALDPIGWTALRGR